MIFCVCKSKKKSILIEIDSIFEMPLRFLESIIFTVSFDCERAIVLDLDHESYRELSKSYFAI